MKKVSRFVGVVILIALGFLLLKGAVQRKQLDRRVRMMLLEVQTALQKYHVEEEMYPKQAMAGRELVSILSENGFLDEKLQNPWARDFYVNAGEDDDWLRYRTDSLAETYELKALFPKGGEVHYRLDSVENHSLEESNED